MRWSVRTIGDLTRVPLDELRAQFGKNGVYLFEAAHGRDDSPIVTESRPKSISEENTFEHDTRDPKRVEAFLTEMSQGVGLTLQREGYLARTLVLKLRYADFTTITRQTTLHMPTAEPKQILIRVKHLLNAHWDRRRALRLVGIGAHNVVETASAWQLEFGLDA